MAKEALMSADVNCVHVRGRVVKASVKREDVYYTEIATPAPDPFSQPGLLEVRSSTRLGGKDEDVDISCRVGGYRRKAFEAKDRDTGEIRVVKPISMTLDLITG